ncbi:stretch-activated cation channel mid1 [Mortierella claussenii]|nr:stretch-activated cation channel mid1 [Mortierella claussenii]
MSQGHAHSSCQRRRRRRTRSAWTTLFFAAACVIAVATTLVPPATAQTSATSAATPPSSTSTTSATVAPGPSQIPIPPPDPPTPVVALPPGTRELQDGQVVADRVAQGQLQTYHFSVAQQQQHIPVRRQLERIIFHPGPPNGMVKRQSPISSTSSSSPASQASSSTSSLGAPAPTRTIAPTLPSPFANGTYAVYISVSTCSTPKSGANVCPPLTLYVSVSSSQPLPGPGQDSKVVQVVTSQEGLIQFTAYTNKDIFFSLQAPTLQGTWTGDWAVEVGASSQGYVQGYQSSQGLVLDDTDSMSASFLTHNFTAVPTFKVYLVNSTSLPAGLTHSLCAIEVIQPMPLTKANMVVTQTNRTSNLDGSMGRLILPPVPTFEQFGQRRQVLMQLLTPGTEYTAFFITDVLNQAGAEVMYAMTPFKTKRHDNCVLITDLQFCQEVTYAVPITPQSTLPGGSGAGAGAINSTIHQDVKHFYDDFTSNLMDNFRKVLGQYDCSKSQYSLVRNCTDCERAYRRWLCGISIPRCTDVEDVTDPNNVGYTGPPTTFDPNSNENPYLGDRANGPVVVGRNTNTSRGAIAQLSQNPLMNPGDYGEVLPCVDLCYDVVQSCPSFLGFSCPVKNIAGNYAKMNAAGFQCNGLGVVPIPSSARSATVHGSQMLRMVVTMMVMVLVSMVV